MAKLLYVSCGDCGAFALERHVAEGREFAAVVTIPPQLAKKHNVSGYVDLAPFCKKHGIRLISLEKYTLEPEALMGIDFDVLVVNGWNRLIPESVYGLARFGSIGLHLGHPPTGLGRAPIVWNIIKGFDDVEVYAFALTPRADDGDILASQVVEITPYDNARTLYEKVSLNFILVTNKALEVMERGERGIRQDLEYAEHYPRRTPADGAINFNQPVHTVHNFIRAQTDPYPGAFAYLNSEKWTIWEAQPFDRFAFRNLPRVPGKIVDILPSGPIVMTASETLWCRQVSIEGSDVSDWIKLKTNIRSKILTAEPKKS